MMLNSVGVGDREIWGMMLNSGGADAGGADGVDNSKDENNGNVEGRSRGLRH